MPWASCVRSQFAFSASYRHVLNHQHQPQPQPAPSGIHSQGGISMVTTTPGQTALTRFIDHAVSNYGIEVNHADNASTDRHIRQLCNVSARTIVPAMAADEGLVSLKLARRSETQLRTPYRGNCASCLATTGTSWRYANRGPPRTGLSRSLRGPRGCAEGRKHSARRGSEEKGGKKRDRGLGPQSLPPNPDNGSLD